MPAINKYIWVKYASFYSILFILISCNSNHNDNNHNDVSLSPEQLIKSVEMKCQERFRFSDSLSNYFTDKSKSNMLNICKEVNFEIKNGNLVESPFYIDVLVSIIPRQGNRDQFTVRFILEMNEDKWLIQKVGSPGGLFFNYENPSETRDQIKSGDTITRQSFYNLCLLFDFPH